jgi:hypothetical protein
MSHRPRQKRKFRHTWGDCCNIPSFNLVDPKIRDICKESDAVSDCDWRAPVSVNYRPGFWSIFERGHADHLPAIVLSVKYILLLSTVNQYTSSFRQSSFYIIDYSIGWVHGKGLVCSYLIRRMRQLHRMKRHTHLVRYDFWAHRTWPYAIFPND